MNDWIGKISKFLFGWAEYFDKKGWLLYFIVGLGVLIIIALMQGC